MAKIEIERQKTMQVQLNDELKEEIEKLEADSAEIEMKASNRVQSIQFSH